MHYNSKKVSRKVVPKTSYFRAWLERRDIDFPSDGDSVSFFIRDISYTAQDFEKIEVMVNELNNLTRTHSEWLYYGRELPKSVQTPFEAATGFWWSDFKNFIANHKNYLYPYAMPDKLPKTLSTPF